MLKHYIKITFRSLWSSKAHSLINIFGLSTGIACCLLIVLFIREEWSYDKFHTKAERIFRAWVKEDWGENQKFFNVATPFPLGPALKENFEEILYHVRIHKMGTQIKVDDNQFSETLTFGGKDLFKVFDFNFIAGSASAMDETNSIVISRYAATKYFGTTDAIGKQISVQIGEVFEEFVVKAVVETLPTNSSIKFYLLISDLNYPKLYSPETLTSSWFHVQPETYLLLREGVDKEALEKKFPPVFKSLLGEEDFIKSHYTAGLQPLTAIHLDPSFPSELAEVSDPKYTYILGGVSFLVLVVACINFVTLSIGRSLKRSKEVGVRKVAGATQNQLVFQFIGEALIITSISLLTGIGLSMLGLPMFNDISQKRLELAPEPFTLLIGGILIVIIGIFAGSYPAFILSHVKPIAVLKGKVPGDSKQRLRTIMIGVQLVLSIFLISSTLIMQRQLAYLQNKNLGYDRDQLVVMQLNIPRGGRLAERVKKGFELAEKFKIAFADLQFVEGVCASSHDFGNGSWTNVGFTDDQGTYRTMSVNVVDEDYISTLKMQFSSGRNFLKNTPADARRSVIINEALAREYNWDDPIGKKIPGKNFPDHEIIGVVKDFNFESLYTRVSPVMFVMDVTIAFRGAENINIGNTPVPKLIVRLKGGNIPEAIDEIETVWNKLASGEEFNYAFVDQTLDNQYRSDQNLGRIMKIATLLAIFIVSLGLYALVSLTMQSRLREVSIRKILGATEKSLLLLLSRDYFGLVAIALVVSIPFTIYLMHGWLQSFEYRIGLDWDVFLLAGGLSLLLAAIAIGHQVIKTTLTSPVKTLKYE